MSKVDSAGIEISAKTLLVRVDRDGIAGEVKSFGNTRKDHRLVCRYLSRRGRVTRVCMESTGLYGLDLAVALSGTAGIELMVCNPRAVRRFAQARMKRSKTDQVDTGVLVEFAARMPLQLWRRPPANAFQLRAITRQVLALIDIVTMQKNQLHAAQQSVEIPRIVLQTLRTNIAQLEDSIDTLESNARRLIDADPDLQRGFDRLQTICGIAKRTALLLMGELSLLPRDMDSKQVTAIAGLDPRRFQSGTSVDQRAGITKEGIALLRRILFMPALVACTRCGPARAFKDRLVARGKRQRQAQVAVMRKLLCAAWAILKTGAVFNPDTLFPAKPVARTAPSTA